VPAQQDFYQLLKLDPSAAQDEVRDALRSELRHWIRRSNNAPAAEDRRDAELRVEQLTLAQSILTDPQQRAEYDRSRLHEPNRVAETPRFGADPQGGTPPIGRFRSPAGDQTIFAYGDLLAFGLKESEQCAVVVNAIRHRSGSQAIVVVGDAWMTATVMGQIEGQPYFHFDCTGRCDSRHPHIVWEGSSGAIEAALVTSSALMKPVLSTLPPMSADERGALEWRVGGILALTMTVAGIAGYGARQIMEALSAGRVREIRDTYVQTAIAAGITTDPRWTKLTPLWQTLNEVLNHPQNLYDASTLAWRSLAPIEEVVRTVRASNSLMADFNPDRLRHAVTVVTLPEGSDPSLLVIPRAVSTEIHGVQGSSCETLLLWPQMEVPPLKEKGAWESDLAMVSTIEGFEAWRAQPAMFGASWLIRNQMLGAPQVTQAVLNRGFDPGVANGSDALFIRATGVGSHQSGLRPVDPNPPIGAVGAVLS
jgi:hypothetical protein